MNSFVYYAPTKVFFGKEKENEVGDICKSYGYKRVFIICGNSTVKSGLMDRVKKALKGSEIEFDAACGVHANPLISRTREILKQARAFKPELILGVGGGSVLDTAKTVAHGVANPEIDIWDYYTGQEKITKSTPVATVLTLAATGSEMSDSSVQTNDELAKPMKFGLSTPFNRCVFAILNPELTQTLPPFQIGTGAADIFLHTSERYFVTADLTGNHMSDEIAEGLMRNIIKYGPIGYRDPSNYEAMSEIMWASSLSHNDITGLGTNANGGKGGDWACHQLGQAMSALYDSTHGASLSAVWASWARYTCDANPDRFVQYGKNVWGLNGEHDAIIKEAIDKTEKWFTELGQPISLTELLGFEVTDEIIRKIAENCSRGKSRAVGQLKKLDYDDMVAIYQMAK